MSYYDNQQWTPPQPSWERGHSAQGPRTSTPSAAPARYDPTSKRPAGSNGPQAQDDFAFTLQFDEIDFALENLQKSGKGYGINTRGRGQGSRPHSDAGSPGSSHFYGNRHQPSRGANEAEQVMQAKRRIAAQRERDLRNLHTEQQYQRNVLTDVPHNSKHMSEEETRELIARQRSALYGEGAFADKTSYVDENGNVRTGAPGPSGPSSIRGHSPLPFAAGDAGTPGSVADANISDASPRPQSTSSPQTANPPGKVFDGAIGSQTRTSASSPTGSSPPRDLALGSKSGQLNATVAPIGTRPTGSAVPGGQSSKRSTTPLAPAATGWGRGSGVWGQSSSGLGTQASVWG